MTLFAGQGVDNTRINEITDDADVGFGSFYNHFDRKEAIVEAVLAETVAAQGEAIEAVTSQLEDPAEVIAAAHRHFVRRARSDPDWGWLLVRLDVSHNVMLAALGSFARRDLRRAIKAGRLRVSNEQVALVAAGGALLAVMRAVLDGRAPRDADIHHAEGCCGSSGSRARTRPKSPAGHCPLRTCRRHGPRRPTTNAMADDPNEIPQRSERDPAGSLRARDRSVGVSCSSP